MSERVGPLVTLPAKGSSIFSIVGLPNDSHIKGCQYESIIELFKINMLMAASPISASLCRPKLPVLRR